MTDFGESVKSVTLISCGYMDESRFTTCILDFNHSYNPRNALHILSFM